MANIKKFKVMIDQAYIEFAKYFILKVHRKITQAGKL